MFPYVIGRAYAAMVSDDGETWRRACGAKATSDGNMTFDEPVCGRWIAIADESPDDGSGIVTEIKFIGALDDISSPTDEFIAGRKDPEPKVCAWCGADAASNAARHESPHATWCAHFRESQRGGPK